MSMFNHEARQFKFDVLKEISQLAYEGKLTDDSAAAISRKLIPGRKAEFRCCVYKEREILRQRTRLACGKMADEAAAYNPRQIVQVIDAACDGCTIRKIQITDNCRKCMAKACLASCKFDAISMGLHRAQIDYTKCKECGACARSCPYNAIVVTERPCSQHCPVDAIRWDENGIAQIDETKCINCGACQAACPFGAIEDMSWIVPVVSLLKMGTPMFAIVAPAIQGQFDNATLPQIKKSIELLGFEKVYEVALGADAVAWEEQAELAEKMEAGVPMTTSCCPAFVNLAKMHFPQIYENNMSTVVSPMMALARKLKKDHPDHGVIFIGPCLAKKQEAMESFTAVDYVLTFEEIAAIIYADLRCIRILRRVPAFDPIQSLRHDRGQDFRQLSCRNHLTGMGQNRFSFRGMNLPDNLSDRRKADAAIIMMIAGIHQKALLKIGDEIFRRKVMQRLPAA